MKTPTAVEVQRYCSALSQVMSLSYYALVYDSHICLCGGGGGGEGRGVEGGCTRACVRE